MNACKVLILRINLFFLPRHTYPFMRLLSSFRVQTGHVMIVIAEKHFIDSEGTESPEMQMNCIV